MEDFSKTNRSLVLREANVDGVHGSVLGTGRFASLCICHAWVEGASSSFDLEEDSLSC